MTARRAGLILVAAMLLVLVAGAWVGSPYDSVDPAALRLIPPATQIEALELQNGRLAPIAGRDLSAPGELRHELELHPDAVRYRRGPRLVDLKREQVVFDGATPRRRTLTFPLGTDTLGRDLLARLVVGARASLTIGLLGIAGAALFAAIAGLLSVVGGPRLRGLLIWLETLLLGLPLLLIALALAALLRPSLLGLASILALTGWAGMSRLVRAELTALTRSDLWLAAQASGETVWRRAWRHLLPHARSVLLVAAALRLGPFLLMEAALSFLGFGVAPPHPSWGNILADGRQVLFEAWWVATIPGMLLGITVVAATSLADRLRSGMEPGRSP